MQELKKMISRYMTIITAIIAAVIIFVAFVVNVLEVQKEARDAAESMLIQIEQLIEKNQQDVQEVEEEYRKASLDNVQAIAYILEQNPSIIDDGEELEKIASFMNVDEIHIIDADGCIYAGTHPQYYNFTFDSGEQIGFFRSMLTDKSLRLVQDIMPNTAENKLMQYSAVWSENEKFIVQVGMEPVRVHKLTQKNDLTSIFNVLKVNVGVDYYGIDANDGRVVGSTITEVVGKTAEEIGLEMSEIEKDKNGFHTSINKENSFVIFKRVGDNWIGRSVKSKLLYGNLPGNVLGVAICCIIMGIVQVFVVTKYLNSYVVEGIREVNEKLNTIASGKLTETVDVRKSREFVELSQYINDMVRSLMAGNRRLTYALSKTNMLIGVYEYNDLTKRVIVTDQIQRIFELNDDEMEVLLSDKQEFKKYISLARRRIIEEEEDVYYYKRFSEKYIRIEELYENGKMFGIIIDVTDEMLKRKQIEAERDIDLLTGLYNRRGLENHLERLFRNPASLRHGAIVMIDADGLKHINDKYGHKDGDIYLRKVANIIKGFGINESFAFRQGGDEFVLVLYDYVSDSEVVKVIETLEYIQNNSVAHLSNGDDVPLKFSYGFTLFDGRADYVEMMKEADEKMYANKRIRKAKLKEI